MSPTRIFFHHLCETFSALNLDATKCSTGINNFEANAVAVTVICAKILQRPLAMGLVPSHNQETT
jgi:hypothetical protein